MTRRSINITLVFFVFALVTAFFWVYYITIQLTSRDTARLVALSVERALGGECQIGELSLAEFSRIHVSSLVVFRDDGAGELFNISSADINIAFPQCLTGKVLVEGIVLNNPSFELKGPDSGGITQLLGGAVKENTDPIQIQVKGGTVRFAPFPENLDFVLNVGPLDMFLVAPQGKKMPILRGASTVLGSKFEVFAEYFTAPERVLFKYYLSEFDLVELEKLSGGTFFPFEITGGRGELKGSYTIARRQNEHYARVTLNRALVKLKNNSQVTLDGALDVSGDKIILAPNFTVTSTELGTFDVSGTSEGFKDMGAQLKISCDSFNLASIPSLIRGSFAESFSDVSIKGRGKLTCTIDGPLSAMSSYKGKLDLHGGEFAYKNIPFTCNSADFNTSVLSFDGISTEAVGGNCTGRLATDLVTRNTSMGFSGKSVSAAMLSNLLKEQGSLPSFLDGFSYDGFVEGEFSANGAITTDTASFREWISASTPKGRFTLANVNITSDQSSFKGVGKGSFHLAGSTVRVFDFSVSNESNVITVDGSIDTVFSDPSLSLAVKSHGKGNSGNSLVWAWDAFSLESIIGPTFSKNSRYTLEPVSGEVWLNSTFRGPLSDPQIFGEIKHESVAFSLTLAKEKVKHLCTFSVGRLAFDGKSLWSDSSVVDTPWGTFDYVINVRKPLNGEPVMNIDVAPIDDKAIPFVPFYALAGGSADGLPLFKDATVSGRLKLKGTPGAPSIDSDLLLTAAEASFVRVKGFFTPFEKEGTIDLDLSIEGVKGITLEKARYLVPGLATSHFAFWMKENGALKGQVKATGNYSQPDLEGSLGLETLSGEHWELVLETDRTKDSKYALTARCENGRIEKVAPLFRETASTELAPYAPRLPFDGIIRWSIAKNGESSLKGKIKLRRGAFDLPSVNDIPVEMSVLGGLVSFVSRTVEGKPTIESDLELTLKSPLVEIAPEPVVIKGKDILYNGDEFSFGTFSLLLFGESIVARGKVDKLDTVARLNLEIPGSTYSLSGLAKKTLPLNAGISLKGTLDVTAALTGTWKYPEVAGGMKFKDVHLESYYQKGIPLSFASAEVEFTSDNIFFKPFPVKLGLKDTVFPASGGLKEVLGTDNVWRLVLLEPMVAWKKIKDHIYDIDRQSLITKAIGKEEYGKLLRSAAHRIKTWIWTETREDPYVYDAFLTNDENLAFDNTRDDIVHRYEDIAKRSLAAKEGFSTSGFGEQSYNMLRIRKVSSSVLDRDGNQIWPEAIPKWRLDRTPGVH